MAWLLVSGGLAYVGAAAVTGADRTTPASFAAFATGTALHADAVQAGAAGPRIADVDEAFGGATVNTAGLPNTVTNEFGESIQPDNVTGKQAGARGSGLEVGLATNLPNDPNAHQILLAGQADATARPDTPTVTKQIGPINLNPVAYASLLTGQAEAQFGNLLDRCPTLPIAGGLPFSRGRGEAAKAQVLNIGTSNPDGSFNPPLLGTDSPGQDVTFSEATTKPFDNGDGTFGLVTEVHQRLAPVRIGGQLLVTIGGEWVLRATVTGHPAGYRGAGTGGAKIEYAPPGNATPTTNLVLIQQIGPLGQLTDLLQITLQQLLGATGLTLPANPLLDLAVGEDPRAIGGDANSNPTASADGTTASAAVDVLRLQLIPGATQLANLRLGHMEVSAKVPDGGFSFNDCGQLKVTKNVVGNVTGPFNFNVACANLNPADALTPAESNFTLPAGGSKVIPVPTGKTCTVSETGKGSATATTIDESGGTTGTDTHDGVVTIPAGLSTVTVGFTNSSAGFLKVIKSSQSTLTGSPAFAASCTPAAAAVPATFTMGPNDSKTFGPITGGTTCSVTETNAAGAAVTRVSDTTAPTTDGSVFIAGNDTQTVSFSNAGPPLVISKNTTGDDAAGKGPFDFTLSCTTPPPANLAVPLSAADSSFTLAAGQEHRVNVDIPDGSSCVATETGTGGATTTSAADSAGDTTDRTVTVTHGVTQVISFTNTFVAPVRLIVSKTVVNPQTNPAATAFAIHVQCFPSVAGGTPLTLAAGDADFTLAAGQSHGIKGIPVNALCVVTEPNPQGAARTFQEASGNANDGAVIIPANGAITVGVTNTFNPPEPPINVGPNVINPLPVQPVVVQPRTVG